MGKAIPQQHPAVVLRSHYRAVRALLVVAMVAIVGLSGAVVIVANDDDAASTPNTALQYQESPATHAHPKGNLAVQQPTGSRYDGGPDEGTRGPFANQGPAPAQDESQAHPGFRTD
jgi:hypothetical protein